MKLILRYDDGDGYGCSCEIVVPIEYDSEEALLCDFMNRALFAFNQKRSEFEFSTEKFPVRLFVDYDRNTKEFYHTKIVEYPPDIYTLDDWFRLYHIWRKDQPERKWNLIGILLQDIYVFYAEKRQYTEKEDILNVLNLIGRETNYTKLLVGLVF